MPRYKIYSSDNKIIAVSSFAGKPVKGIAKCDPSDTFSSEVGTELAVARCNNKVAVKRVRYADSKLDEAIKAFMYAKANVERMSAYYEDACKKLAASNDEVDAILAKLR